MASRKRQFITISFWAKLTAYYRQKLSAYRSLSVHAWVQAQNLMVVANIWNWRNGFDWLVYQLQAIPCEYCPGKTAQSPWVAFHQWSVICLLVGCLTPQQHASISQGRICSDNCMCCHTETATADRNIHFTQSHYTDTGPTSPSVDPIMPGAKQGSHWSANFQVTDTTRPGKIPTDQEGIKPWICRSQSGHLNHYANEVVKDVSYSDDRPFSSMQLMQKHGGK